MGQSVLAEYLVDCADIAAPVKVGGGIGELNHGDGGCEGVDISVNNVGSDVL